MEILSQFTPTETYLISEGKKVSFKNLLKYTLTDLFFRKVLRVIHKIDDSTKESIKYVTIGSNFSGYQPKHHERAFVEPFTKSPDLEILFSQLIKSGYQHAGSRKQYVFNSLLRRKTIGECFKNGFFKRLFCSISLTIHGIQVKKDVDIAFAHLETKFADLIQSDPTKASEILKSIGGNIFLLQSFDFELLKQIDKELSEEIERQNAYTEDNDHFLYFDSYFDDFDTEFTSFGGSDAGCSSNADGGGDSGCSGGGCSGCGGCGGCGG